MPVGDPGAQNADEPGMGGDGVGVVEELRQAQVVGGDGDAEGSRDVALLRAVVSAAAVPVVLERE